MAVNSIFFASRDVMLTSLCVVSTSLLVSTGAVSCYRALMVNFIWFTDVKCSLHQYLATWGHEIRCLVLRFLNHFAGGVCWCTVLLEGVKVRLSSQVHKSDCFGRFLWLQ